MEEKVSEEFVYRGKLFSVRRDRVKIKGRVRIREVVIHPGASAILPILDDGKILLVRQYRYAVGEELLEIPAGTLEVGEKPEDCALRELEEETGYRAENVKLLTTLYLAPGYSSERLHLFQAENLKKRAQKLEVDEEIELVTMELREVLNAIKNGKIRDAKTIAAILYYFTLHSINDKL